MITTGEIETRMLTETVLIDTITKKAEENGYSTSFKMEHIIEDRKVIRMSFVKDVNGKKIKINRLIFPDTVDYPSEEAYANEIIGNVIYCTGLNS